LDRAVHGVTAEVYVIMATALASHGPENLAGNHFSSSTGENGWIINLTIDVDADARRIFQALTVPEYIEAWITLPGQSDDSVIQAAEEKNGYCIDHYVAGRRAVNIRSSYLFRHQKKMRMFWKKTRETSCLESLVDFRLRGNFGDSVLELRHMEIQTFADFEWHLSLWRNSLGKLASLLRSA
jgi:hypothetical protein